MNFEREKKGEGEVKWGEGKIHHLKRTKEKAVKKRREEMRFM
jgi:hypothetical protein